MVETSFFHSSIKEPIDERYNVKESVSSGPLSVVYDAHCKNTKRNYVVKKIGKNPFGIVHGAQYLKGDNLDQAEAMAKGISRIRHPNVAPVTDIYEDRDNVYVVMEHVEGGELFTRLAGLESYSEFHVASIVRDVLSAVQYLHSEDIIHSNIKPENLLSGNDSEFAPTLLSDFYMSSLMSHGVLMNSVCGNPSYVAPEVLNGFVPTKASDIWSVGVITYVLLSGLEPFPSPKGGDAGTYSNVVRCDFEFIKPFFNKISLNAQDFISTILKVNPNDRASISSCFEHPWLKGDAARMEPMVGVGQRLAESLMKKRESLAQKGSLQISRVLARYNTKTPLEEVETPFAVEDEPEEELTTDAIDFSDPEALAKALNMSSKDMKQ